MSTIFPRRYFATSGRGVSRASILNAFDEALKDARLWNYNLVPVSSIIPENAEEVDPPVLPPGSIVFVVMSKMTGRGGEPIVAGIAWAEGVDAGGRRYGCVVEANGSNEEEVGKRLTSMLDEMCRSRGLRVVKKGRRIESMVVPEGHYGCVVAAVALI